MKRWSLPRFFAVAVVVAGCADDPVHPDRQSAPQFAQSADGRYIVELNGNADVSAAVAALGGTVEFAHADAGVATVSGLTPESAAQLRNTPGVGAVHEDVAVELVPGAVDLEPLSVDLADVNSATNPAGSLLFSRQWNMRQVGAHTAWAAGKLGSADVTVAILDTGIDYENADLAGLVDHTRSANFVPSDGTFMNTWLAGRNHTDDLNGHGTNVAATVASNGAFFGGMNSFTRLMAVKVLGRTGSGTLSGIINGLIYAADQGADVANMSLGVRFGVNKRGNGSFIGATNRAFNYAHRKGMVVVVSAGNDTINMDAGLNFSAYCEAPHVVCVSALGPTSSGNVSNGPWVNPDALAGYSNFGKAITVGAPGGTGAGFVQSICARRRVTAINPATGAPTFGCLTATPNSAFIVGYAGTSQASPHVAGLVAKLVEIHGKNNPAQVKHALVTKGVDDLGTPGKDPVYGAGRINVVKALGL